MNLEKLFNNRGWKTAIIVFDSSNWTGEDYTEEQRSYRVRSDAKYFNSNANGRSLYGNCLDGKDLGVRLDWFNWKVEKIIIE